MWKAKYNSETKIWSGPHFQSVFSPTLSLGQLVLWLLERNPSKIAQISDNNNKYMTNAELRLKTVRAALKLQELGFKENDVLALVSKTNHDVAPVVFAAFCLGCPVNALGTTFHKSEIVHMFGITKPKGVFCDEDNYDVVKASLRELNNDAMIFTFEKDFVGSIRVDTLLTESIYESRYQASQLDPQNTAAMIVCTSGTTGLPKGVRLSHAVLVNYSSRGLHLNDEDIYLTMISLNWITAICALVYCTVQGATRVITTAPFSEETFLRIVEQRKVTAVFTASFHVNFLLKSPRIRCTDLTKLTKFYCGGSKIAGEIVDEMNKFLPNGAVYIAYGTSEAGAFLCSNFPLSNSQSVGKIVSGIRMKIIDDDGQKLGINQIGEVCYKSLNKFLGYYGNDEATADLMDADGFLKSGDIGYIDKDGYLFLIDRKKDIFKYYSTHISPSEFEDILANHSAIKTVCIVDVPDPLGEAPHLPTALIVKSGVGDISSDEVHRIVSENLPKEKRLAGGVYFTEQLPITITGKIKRIEARQIAKEFFEASQKGK